MKKARFLKRYSQALLAKRNFTVFPRNERSFACEGLVSKIVPSFVSLTRWTWLKRKFRVGCQPSLVFLNSWFRNKTSFQRAFVFGFHSLKKMVPTNVSSWCSSCFKLRNLGNVNVTKIWGEEDKTTIFFEEAILITPREYQMDPGPTKMEAYKLIATIKGGHNVQR